MPRFTNQILACHFFILFIFYPFNLHTQPKDLRFEHLTTNDGLSQSAITCILQDVKGFMWFGTFDGLNRYDGYEFEVYRFNSKDSASISYDFITTLYEDSRKNLWVGTSQDLNRYDRESDSFTRFSGPSDDSLNVFNNYIQAISEDKDGNLWLGSRGGGLNLLDKHSNKINSFKRQSDSIDGLSTDYIYSLLADSRGNIWIGGQYGDLDLYDRQANRVIHFKYGNRKISEGMIKSIVEDENGNIWVGAQGNGIYAFTLNSKGEYTIRNYRHLPGNSNSLSSDLVLSLISDHNFGLWIGTENDGLNFFDRRQNTFTRYRKNTAREKSLNHDSIWSLYLDRTQNLWVGTFAGGVNFHSSLNQPLRHYRHYPGNQNSLSNNSVSAFWEDKNGNVWIATDGGGLNLFDIKDEIFKTYNSRNSNLSNDAVLSLFEDSYGNFWVGTWSGGLNLFDRTNGVFTHYTSAKHGLGADNVYVIHEDRARRLWVGTYWGGLNYFDQGKQRFINYRAENSDLPDNQVRVIKSDYRGNLWIGCESGLVKFNPDDRMFVSFSPNGNDPFSISNAVINSIFEASDSVLWVGTAYGLNRFNRTTGGFARYHIEDGLPNNYIQAITEDDVGNLWISTNKGLSRFNDETGVFKNFVISDGLQGNEFYRNSVFKSRDHSLYFGGQNGFNIIDPGSVLENPNIPPIIITDFQIFNKPVTIGGKDSPLKKHISETKELALSYKHSVFSFEFTALNYISPEKNSYAYIMEGFEKDWNYVGSKRTATYTNLAAGRYVFRVKGSNNDNKWNEKGASVFITIEPPFWKTWWAYLLYLGLSIAAIYSVMHYFLARERLKSALEMEHLELEKMHELDQMKSRFFANISHEFRTPITLILGPLERLISNNTEAGALKQRLHLIYRNAQRLLRLSNQLMDFHKIEAEDLKLELSKADIIQFIKSIVDSFREHANHHQINMMFAANLDSKRTWFDVDKIDKIIYNILSNAFKFTKDNGEISVEALIKTDNDNDSLNNSRNGSNGRFGKEYIEIIIKDNGIGIPHDKIKHIFKRFYQVDNVATLQHHGTGIGLALTYELVQLYHGEIAVSSEVNQGTEFIVRLPLDKYFLEEHQLVGHFNLTEFYSSSEESLGANTEKTMPSEMNAKMPEIDFKPKSLNQTILIVEDDEELLTYLKDAFQPDYRILTASNGLAGHEKAIEWIPDIAICDIMMPGMDGMQLCEALRTNEKTSHIPIILLTARASDEHRIKGLQTGADAYITKPFNLEVVQASVTNLLDSRKKLRERFGKDVFLNPTNMDMTSVDEQFLQRLIGVIEENMPEPEFNADVLSKKIGMSRMQLYRKLRSLTDQTVHEFIRNLRLKRAVLLLEKKRLTVTEVAYQVGFNDLTYFARCFRKRFGKLPSEYRMKSEVRR